MIIDSHQHFWQYSIKEFVWINDSMHVLKRDFLPQELSGILTSNRIQGSIAIQARQSLEETQWLLALSDQFDSIHGVVGWVHLCKSSIDGELKAFSTHPKFKGVRHVVQDEPDERFLLNDDFLNGIRILGKYNLIYEILIFPHHLPAAIEFVRRFPDQTFILNHIAKPLIRDGILDPWQDQIRKLAEFPNVFCKVSGMVTEADWNTWQPTDFYLYLDVTFDAFHADRLLFGSDWPVCTVAASYGQVVNILLEYMKERKCSQNEIDAVFGVNACRVYHL